MTNWQTGTTRAGAILRSEKGRFGTGGERTRNKGTKDWGRVGSKVRGVVA